jgi:hypothetical protein
MMLGTQPKTPGRAVGTGARQEHRQTCRGPLWGGVSVLERAFRVQSESRLVVRHGDSRSGLAGATNGPVMAVSARRAVTAIWSAEAPVGLQ